MNNDDSYWFRMTALGADSFSYGTPILLFDFPVIAPGAVRTLAFEASAGAGIYGLIWDVDAPVGFINSGSFGVPEPRAFSLCLLGWVAAACGRQWRSRRL